MDRTRLRPQGDSTGGPSNKCGPVCDRTCAQPRRSPRLSGTGWDRQNVQALKRALHKGNSARQPAGKVLWNSRVCRLCFVQIVFCMCCGRRSFEQRRARRSFWFEWNKWVFDFVFVAGFSFRAQRCRRLWRSREGQARPALHLHSRPGRGG